MNRAESQGLVILIALAFLAGVAMGLIAREVHEEAKQWAQ